MKNFLLGLFLALSCFCYAQRLPGNLVPDHYALQFNPDFATNSFQGDESIDVHVLSATNTIVLDAVEMEFKSATVSADGKQLTATVKPNGDKETVTLHLPSAIAAGAGSIHIHYVGTLNDKLRGLYRSEANGRKYAVTQFEAIDARAAFPSFDEPAYKATFDISAVVDKNDTAISNGKIISDEPGPTPGKHTIKFSTTPKMSSYLVALTVGDWKCISGEQDGIPLRVCSVPGKEQQGKFALEATKAILRYYDQYFSIKYPYEKLDQIAAPDFEAGAMENTAAIIYREQDLLIDEANASVDDQREVAFTIAHEMAHQWFGDLVTMKWWNDIWLNEGFASWMENKPVAAWKPEWNVSQLQAAGTGQALNVDSVQNTRPIRQKAELREEINSLFDGIAYGKTAAVLRMLEGYLGEDAFRKGVNSYIEAHKYANATAEDFWTAMTQASGKPVDKIMSTFVIQPGAPFVSVDARCTNGDTEVALSQQRFYSSPKLMQERSNETWQIPVCMSAIGGSATACDVLSQKQQTFKLKGCSAGVFPDVNGAGLYRYSFDPALYTSPKFDVKELSAEDQVSLIGNEGALLASGQHHIQQFLSMATKFRGVDTPEAVSGLSGQLTFAHNYLVTAQDRAQYEAWIRDVFNPTLQKIGMNPSSADTPGVRNVRATLVRLLGNAGEDPQVIAFAKKIVADYMQNVQGIDPTLLDACFPVAAAHGDAALYDAFLAKTKTTSHSPQEYYRYFHALSNFRDPALLKRTREWSLGPDVRNQDMGIMFGVLTNPAGKQLAWDFIRERYADIENKAGQSIFGAQYAYYAVGVFCDSKSRSEGEQFLREHAVPGLERVGRQQLERVDQCIDLRQREEGNFAKYFEKPASSSGQH
jgi:aminopeptidase N